MPRFTPADLSSLLECDPNELPGRVGGFVSGGHAELCLRIIDLRRRAQTQKPTPTREELCLGLLALLALQEGSK